MDVRNVKKLDYKMIRGGLILKPTRRIDSANAKAFESEAHALLNEGSAKVVMDVSDLDYISSAGLRAILTTAEKAKAAGGGLTIVRASANVKEALEISGFDAIFGIHPNVEAALASFESQ